MAERDLSILVVSYDTRELMLACLSSVERETQGLDYEVIVVDNASTDGTPDAIEEAFPAVRVIRETRNLGFAAANNRAAAEASGRVLLLLNPDTEIRDGAVQKSLRFLESRRRAGAVGVRTLFEDGRLNPHCCFDAPSLWNMTSTALGLSALFRHSPLFNAEEIGGWQRDGDRAVDVLSGCYLLIWRDLWQKLDGFDERFFMYSEDTDLCIRIWNAGRECWHFGGAEIVHHGGGSDRIRAEKLVKVFEAKGQFVRKHWGDLRARIACLLLDARALVRVLGYGIAAALDDGAIEKRETWRAVLRSRDRWWQEPAVERVGP